MVTVKIVPNETSNPPGKLADAELHFETAPGSDTWPTIFSLAGLKLIGFAIWERRTGTGRNVTFPARQYSVNGERRSFALLRPSADVDAQNRLRDLILQAYADHEAQQTKTDNAREARHQEEQRAAQSTETTTPATDPPIQAPTSYNFGF